MTDGVLLDIAGVLHEGKRPLPGAVEAVARLRAAGLPVRFLTNTTRRPKRRVLERLAALGFDVVDGEVLTPAAAARGWLNREGYAPHLLVHPDLEEDFADCAKDGPVAVIVGDAGRSFTYERLNAAFREIEAGAPFLALAANRVFRDEDGKLSLDAGAFVKALEHSSGVSPHLLGKPAPAFFRAGVESFGCRPDRVAMVGDDAESDVAGALAAGLGQGILVRSGKYRDGDENRFAPRPTCVVEGIGAAVDVILGVSG
ncbi:TIGR01458 family HAD-type hydrolase [Tropicimonas sp. IMCC6043]|uniref:TIGR01458 family HAD-type hydrolase n=1 Tax=Tropicimonas sp. IMCC6043 TaxID=2510645 RepID=UPI00101B764E|nr:TIGR01458 family HAD-type hydrolase [Tropicimonas sp. IMCC6043]RYH11703.1 TIGR01458 family HAD-type hydrolase [Tropicimonas sp. IMCC6043]